jgi:hypothetical protein
MGTGSSTGIVSRYRLAGWHGRITCRTTRTQTVTRPIDDADERSSAPPTSEDREDGVDVSNPGKSKVGEDLLYLMDDDGEPVDVDGNPVLWVNRVFIDDEKKVLVP